MSSKTFTVQTEPGKPDSFKGPVRIAFTTTPVESGKRAHDYDPIANVVSDFSHDTAKSARVQWCSRTHFGKYRTDGKKLMRDGQADPINSPGQVVTLVSAKNWSVPAPCDQKTSFVATNRSGSAAKVMLGLTRWHLAYHTLGDGCSISAPSSFQLQAYIVDDEIHDGIILQPEDLKRPVFTSPISWDILPESSIWTLYRDDQNQIKLKNEDYPGLGYLPTPPEAVTESPSEKDPLSEVLERLGAMEKSMGYMRDDIDEGKRAIAELHDQVSTLEASTRTSRTGLDLSIAAVEAKAATLAGTFDKSQDRLSLVHKAVTDTQQFLAGVEKASSDFNRRLPLVESKAEKIHERVSNLEDTTNRTRDHVIAVEKAVHHTQDHVSLVQQLVVSNNTRPSAMRSTSAATVLPGPVPHSVESGGGDTRITQVEAKVEKLEKSAQEQRKAFRVMDRRLPMLEADLGSLHGSVAGLERRVNVVELRTEGDEAGIEDEPSSSIGDTPVVFPSSVYRG